eukprot:CAMPEP_0174999012 /NCGR_PEP_ID=MMETSP0005-20121125/1818_1 /TAXON_ID=420556 /ORGANISM="Ochromonas sp., Strain CCMP1393" /LENGTH=181 /DNA_ID=CAMNT_0016253693 /DNA_START=162 /DNA_END=703 /DNA_ORIENTATION=+
MEDAVKTLNFEQRSTFSIPSSSLPPKEQQSKEKMYPLQNSECDRQHQKADRYFVVVDDIMHLKSMRRQVYTIARDNGNLPVITIWMNTDIDTAIERNRCRKGIETIGKIHASLEPPDPVMIFDRHYCIVAPTPSCSTCTGSAEGSCTRSSCSLACGEEVGADSGTGIYTDIQTTTTTTTTT